VRRVPPAGRAPPRGSRRGDDGWRADLQVAKGFRLGGMHLRLVGAVVNVHPSEAPVTGGTDPLHPGG
jgi:hypothetical protein